MQTATEQSQQTRRVAAMPSDQPQYTYADNSGGKPSAPAKRSRPTTNVPAPLDPSFQAANATDASGRLDDPESHYIVDARTGRVVGIDGSAGARREEAEEQLQQSNTAPETVAAQTPAPEIRVASPVIEAGQPVYHGAPPASVNVSGSQYVPVRKALPVTADEVNAAPRAFNAGEYRLTNQDRPVLRAQPVIPTGARVVKTVRIYHLPDGTQTVAVD